MAELQSTNVTGTLCVNGVAVGGGKDLNVCCITASTNFTPTSDLVSGDGHVCALLVGGGGAAGKTMGCNIATRCLSAGGGGGGEVRDFFYPVTASEAHCVIVGAGGQSGSLNFPSYPQSDFPGEGGDTSMNGVCCISVIGGGRGGSVLQNPAFGTPIGNCTRNGGCVGTDGETSTGGGGSSLPCYGKHYAYAYCSCGNPGSLYRAISTTSKNNYFLFEGYCSRCGMAPTASTTTLPTREYMEDGSPGQGTQTPYGIFGVGGEGACSTCTGCGCKHVPYAAPAWHNSEFQASCCPCQATQCNGIVCGGGGAGLCWVGGQCYDPAKTTAPGGCGADGVVILRWYE